MGHRKLFHGIIVSFITSIIMYFLSCYSIILNSKAEIIIITTRNFGTSAIPWENLLLIH